MKVHPLDQGDVTRRKSGTLADHCSRASWNNGVSSIFAESIAWVMHNRAVAIGANIRVLAGPGFKVVFGPAPDVGGNDRDVSSLVRAHVFVGGSERVADLMDDISTLARRSQQQDLRLPRVTNAG
jgi:hypothetical protein